MDILKSKQKIILCVLYVLIILSCFLGFLSFNNLGGGVRDYSNNIFQLALESMKDSSSALNYYTYYYLPIVSVVGIVMLFVVKRAMNISSIIGIVGAVLSASELITLLLSYQKTDFAGKVSAGIGGILMIVLYLIVFGIGVYFRKRDQDGITIEEKEKNANFSNMMRKYGLVVIILVIAIEMSIISNVFLSTENLLNVLRQVSINGIMAMGMTFIIITGGIDLSVGSLLAVSGVITGSVMSINPEYTYLAILAGILVCAGFGFFSGLSIAKFKLPPFVVTLSVMTIARGFALVHSDGKPYILNSKEFSFLGKGSLLGIPVPVIVFVIVSIVMWIILTETKLGRYILAVGGNENASRVSGVNIQKIKMIVYTLSGALTGLAGAVLASRISSGQPAIGVGYETDAIAAVVIGGTKMSGGVGTIFGTILGVLIIGLISNGLTLLGVNSYYQQIVKGAIIFIAVLMDVYSKNKKSN